MSQVHKITSLGATWQPGDVVMTADGNLYIRASQDPEYPWGDATQGVLGPVDGGLSEDQLVRPLTLLVRDGVPVGGRRITEGDTPELT